MEAAELALEVGRKEAEKNDAIKFRVINESLGKLATDLVDLQRRRFAAGKALLEECCGMADMKKRINDFREKEAGMEMYDTMDDYDEFEEFGDVNRYVEEFVILDDLLAETKKRKLAADRLINGIL